MFQFEHKLLTTSIYEYSVSTLNVNLFQHTHCEYSLVLSIEYSFRVVNIHFKAWHSNEDLVSISKTFHTNDII